MCSRYPSPHDLEQLITQFELGTLPGYQPQTNIPPTDAAPVILQHDGTRALRLMRWGLLPHWAKDAKGAAKMVNARIETVFEKPAFAKYIRRHRCIVPALGFFEWDEAKNPFLIRMTSGELMGFGGIWSRWHDPVEPKNIVETYSIVTTDANSLVAKVHDRMPVIIPRSNYKNWLDNEIQDPQDIYALTCIIEPGEVELVPQDKAINSSRRKDVALIFKIVGGVMSRLDP